MRGDLPFAFQASKALPKVLISRYYWPESRLSQAIAHA